MKTRSTSKTLLLTLLLTPLTGHTLTLDEAYNAGGAHSHDLQEMRLHVESSNLDKTRARSSFLPKLNLNANHLFDEKFQELEVEFQGNNFVMPATQPYSSLGVTASYEIFSGFKGLNELSAAKTAYQASQHRLNRAEQELQVHIRNLFYRALGSQVLVAVTQQNIETLEGHMKDVRSRERSGVSTKFDSLRVEVQLEEAQTDKLRAETEAVVARAKLFELLGVKDDGQPLQGKLPDDFTKLNLNNASLDKVQREDREAQILDVKRSEYTAKAARAHWMPRVSVFGSQEWYNNINHSTWQDDNRFKSAYSLGVTLNWNLYDGGADLARQRQAVIERKISDEQLAKLNESIPVNLEDSKRRLEYDISNYKAKTISIKKAEEAVRLAHGALRAGTLTNTEVLDAVLDLNRAKASAVRAQIDAVEALGSLELALGHSI